MNEKETKRAKLRFDCEHDLTIRRAAIARCKEDTVFFIDNFAYTYDPRTGNATCPFILFPKQREVIAFFEDLYNQKRRGIFDKSRDVGATWLICAFLAKHWLFTEKFMGSVGSRLAELVDNAGDPDSIFEKIRMLIRALPNWLQPVGWEKASKIKLIVNPQNGAVIKGQVGDNMGRGGRSAVYFIDEFAFVERSKKVIAAVSNNTDCLIPVSTPNGTNNEFYRMKTSNVYPNISLHWKDDPRKNKWVLGDKIGYGWDAPHGAIYTWYERQCLDLDPVVIAQELDLDYSASIEGILIRSIWVRAAVNAHFKIPEIKGHGDIYAGLDVAAGGNNKSVLTIRQGSFTYQEIYRWGDLNPVQLAYTVDDILRKLGVKHLIFDSDGVGMGTSGAFDMIENKPYTVTPFHGASTEGLEDIVINGEDKTAKEKFYNNRAYAWGSLAERFRKTYAVIEGLADYPADELISIPNENTLITQLSQPTIKYSTNGKILLTPKNLLASSPDEADSLVYAFCQSMPVNWWDY